MEKIIDTNHLGQAIGFEVTDWQGAKPPQPVTLEGQYCRIEPLNLDKHARQLFEANSLDREGRIWTYLPYGAFVNFDEYHTWLENSCLGDSPLFFAIIDTKTEQAVGLASYLRIDPANGSIEVGHLCYSPLLSKTIAATEAMYLMMKYIFDEGYRRYEWKCNALNTPSRAAAQRLGFSFEGIFRNAAVIKGRNRDTAWFSITDREWPALQTCFLQWLATSNFDKKGRQKVSLTSLTKALLVSVDKDI